MTSIVLVLKEAAHVTVYTPDCNNCSGTASGRELRAAHPAGPKSPQVRPFITDDARVVGKNLGQIET